MDVTAWQARRKAISSGHSNGATTCSHPGNLPALESSQHPASPPPPNFTAGPTSSDNPCRVLAA